MSWDRPGWPLGYDRAWEAAVGSDQVGVASETGSGAWEVAGERGGLGRPSGPERPYSGIPGTPRGEVSRWSRRVEVKDGDA